MKNFWKTFKRITKYTAAFVAVLSAVMLILDYNTRPLPFEDQPAEPNPVIAVAENGAEKVNETGKEFGPKIENFWNELTKNVETSTNEQTSKNVGTQTLNVDLAAIRIEEAANVDYDRDQYGTAWKDVDKNGCDTRNDILARDLKEISKKGKCTVISGILEDDYTATTIQFAKGNDSVDIDHIVPLMYIAEHGGQYMTPTQREAIANDPENLVAADSSANRIKKAYGPSEWMPSNKGYHCEYANNFANVALKYNLSITQADANAIRTACS